MLTRNFANWGRIDLQVGDASFFCESKTEWSPLPRALFPFFVKTIFSVDVRQTDFQVALTSHKIRVEI